MMRQTLNSRIVIAWAKQNPIDVPALAKHFALLSRLASTDSYNQSHHACPPLTTCVCICLLVHTTLKSSVINISPSDCCIHRDMHSSNRTTAAHVSVSSNFDIR